MNEEEPDRWTGDTISSSETDNTKTTKTHICGHGVLCIKFTIRRADTSIDWLIDLLCSW